MTSVDSRTGHGSVGAPRGPQGSRWAFSRPRFVARVARMKAKYEAINNKRLATQKPQKRWSRAKAQAQPIPRYGWDRTAPDEDWRTGA